MPPRRRQGKRRGPLTGGDGLLFLFDDGVHPLLDPGPRDPRYSVFEAPAVWEQVRVEVWRHELRDLWPPVAALKYDGITERTKDERPRSLSPYEGRPPYSQPWPGWSVEGVREAVEADVTSVEAFRRAKPAAAAMIAEELDDYVTDLRTLLSIAEQFGDELDELDDHPKAAATGWSAYEMRRRAGAHSA